MAPHPPTLRSRLWLLPLRVKLIFLGLIALAGLGGWLVLRDSGLFSVENVTIEGLSRHALPVVREQIEAAARTQTTTDFSAGAVESAVAQYSLVAGVRAETHAPHGVTLIVSERLPIARVDVGSARVPVSADGSVITGYSPSVHLASVRSTQMPVGGHTRDPFVLVALTVLGDAPTPLRHRVAAVTRADGALTIYLRHGPRLIFGDAALPHAKWDAAAAVLASRSSRGAAYVDLVLPSRPAAQVGDPLTGMTASTATAGAPASAAADLNPAVVALLSST